MRISDWSADVCSADLNKRPERLDQIVGQREAVKAVVAVQPDCRVKPRADDRPCDAGSHDSVAIVQKGIWTIGILIPTEIAPQQGGPVFSRCLRLQIVWITGTNAPCYQGQGFSFTKGR